MHVMCDYQYTSGTDGGAILEQPRLFECMGICVLSPAHKSEIRDYLVYLLGPTDNADPPTRPQMRPFPLKREAEKFHAIQAMWSDYSK